MKINKIDYDDVLCFEQFIEKYEDELKKSIEKGEISQELIDNLAATMLDQKEYINDKYEFIIEQIYIAIIETKYFEYPNGYDESIYKLVKYITFLNNDWDIKSDSNYTNKLLTNLCNKVYNKLYNYYSRFLSEKMEEEFKPEHLLDIDYQLDNLKKYSTNKKFLRKLNRRDWRIIP